MGTKMAIFSAIALLIMGFPSPKPLFAADLEKKAPIGDLLAQIGMPDKQMRMSGIDMLSQRRRLPVDAVATLASLLFDDDTEIREATAAALAGQGARAVTYLIEAASHAQTIETRRLAIRALGAMGASAKAAIPALAEATSDGAPEIRRLAVLALGRIAADRQWPEDLPWDSELLAFADGMRRTLTAAIRSQYAPDLHRLLLERITPILISAIDDPDPEVQVAVIKTLSRVAAGDPALRAILVAMAEDAEEQTRLAAINGLIYAAPHSLETLACLRRSLLDRSRDVRQAGIRGYRKAGPAGLASLQLLSQHQRPDVRQTVAEALGDMGFYHPSVIATLEALRQDTDASVRDEATRAINLVPHDSVSLIREY